MTTKQTCCNSRCCWHGLSDDVLKAPNPFNPDKVIWVCPKCKGIDSLYLACDEPGCWDYATMGTHTPTGYRSTCWMHSPDTVERMLKKQKGEK